MPLLHESDRDLSSEYLYNLLEEELAAAKSLSKQHRATFALFVIEHLVAMGLLALTFWAVPEAMSGTFWITISSFHVTIAGGIGFHYRNALTLLNETRDNIVKYRIYYNQALDKEIKAVLAMSGTNN